MANLLTISFICISEGFILFTRVQAKVTGFRNWKSVPITHSGSAQGTKSAKGLTRKMWHLPQPKLHHLPSKVYIFFLLIAQIYVYYVRLLLLKPETDVLDLTETSCRIAWSVNRLPFPVETITYQVEINRAKEQEPILVFYFYFHSTFKMPPNVTYFVRLDETLHRYWNVHHRFRSSRRILCSNPPHTIVRRGRTSRRLFPIETLLDSFKSNAIQHRLHQKVFQSGKYCFNIHVYPLRNMNTELPFFSLGVHFRLWRRTRSHWQISSGLR